MFHKEFRIKSQTAMKGSDRKKLRADIGQQYKGFSMERLSEVIPSKDDMSVVKIETHSQETVVVYMVNKNPMFFQIDKVIYPTVYFLWRHPDLVLAFTTWPEVFKKLEGGAALMLPGVVLPGKLSPTVLGEFPRDCGCAIRLHGNKAPVAVGKTAVSNMEMYESGMKGKGVIVLHTYQDFLWKLGDKSEVPLLAFEDVSANDSISSPSEPQGDGDDSGVAERLENVLTLGDDVDSTNQTPETCDSTAEKDETADVNVAAEGVPDENETVTMSPQEQMDDLLYKCFLYALKTNAKRAELPLLTSTFFRNNMVPCCPKGSSLELKKSSYKKLSKFLAAMQQEGFIKVASSKDVESIISINHEHDNLRSFRIPNWSRNEPQVDSDEPPSAGSSYAPPEITDLLLVTAEILPLMKLYGKEKGSAMTSAEIKQHITDYVKTNDLQEPTNKRMVRVDALLGQTLLHRNEYAEVLPFDDLLPRCQERMRPAYRISFPGKEPQIKKGSLEPIILDINQRAANKKVTVIDNLDLYGIDVSEFASAVQKGVACSASIEKNKDDRRVIVQGNQIRFIGQLLKDNYHLPLKYIKGLEKAPKKK